VQVRDTKSATAFLQARGVPIKGQGLADLRRTTRGPRFSYINGRAVYTDEDLLAWIREQFETAHTGRGRRKVS
jgi:hypothetical protein